MLLLLVTSAIFLVSGAALFVDETGILLGTVGLLISFVHFALGSSFLTEVKDAKGVERV